ncbi:exosortase A [Sphingomonas immobilis]|uniref:Exosortase A n=1 Tax=Sphingomonas immobilis TaxID=3063997 RepID=A0ABT9A372_9SPHN|nr:exosortase A [Sphingomonas sp. CA1-15]MDO7844288.1 exosortase A [Sphingomonas sp. CA1-15]
MRSAWGRHGAILAAVALVILATFHGDVEDLAHLWWTSTTFGHCLFIGPVIAWLVWQRRAPLAALTPVAWAPGLAIVACGGFGWLLGDVGGVALARQLGLVMMLQGSVVTLLGPNVARGLLFPLAYAFFLVPFGEGLEGPLQTVTVAMTMPMLHLAGVPAQVDGVLITIPNGYFEVAEACSGAKFVLAMIAYGALVANVCFVSWSRRAAFFVMALIVPVIANGIRAFGTIYAAYLTSVERATGFDHIVYGWVFFGLVMAAVIAIGWRWFDRAPDAPAFDPARLQTSPRLRLEAFVGAALVLTTAAVFPAWASVVDARADTLPTHITMPDVPGWHRVAMSRRAPWGPNYPGADHYLIGRYEDGQGDPVDLAIAVYGTQHEGKELVAFGVGALREDDVWVRVSDLPDLDGGSVIRVTAPGPVERQIATWYRVGDIVTHGGAAVKIATVEAKLLGGPQRAVAIHISAEVQPGRDPRAAMDRFLKALGPIDLLADRSAGMSR